MMRRRRSECADDAAENHVGDIGSCHGDIHAEQNRDDLACTIQAQNRTN